MLSAGYPVELVGVVKGCIEVSFYRGSIFVVLHKIIYTVLVHMLFVAARCK